MDILIVVLDDFPIILKSHSQFQRLSEVGMVKTFDTRPSTIEEVIQRASGCHTLILLRHHVFFNEQIFDPLSAHLRHLAIWGTGLDHVDIDSASRFGITVSHTPGTSTQSVAEHCMMLIFAAMRDLHRLDTNLRAGKWSSAELMQLSGKILGVIGTGRIGRKVVSLAKALGMDVIAYDTQPDEDISFKLGFEYADLELVLEQADVLSLHVPSNEQTKNMISNRELSLMKRGAILINAARGSLVDESALVDALKSGHLRAAGLDVYAQEPITEDNPLLKLDNVILTPHVADKTPESVDAGMELLVNNVIEFIQKGQPIISATIDN